MSPKLQEPLPTVFSSLAHAMCSGVPWGIFGKGGGSYNWREIVAKQRAAALDFLRQAVERSSAECFTVREASLLVVPPQLREAAVYLLVLCRSGREKGLVQQLAEGDILYLVTAPNALSEGLEMRRLN